MAFLSNRKRVNMNKSENIVSYSESNLEENCVRVLLFKESGCKGRRLIFDSSGIERFSSDSRVTTSLNFQKLTEMVFGSVSLRCQDTYFRIHNLFSPNRIMFTQVFPFPGAKRIEFCTLDSHLASTMKNIFYLGTNDSLQNSSLCFEEGIQLDQHLCNNQFNGPNSSTDTMDSGYGEQSFSSFVISSRSSFNSGVSLGSSENKICRTGTNLCLSEYDLYSTENCSTKTSPVLGLVIILAVTSDNDEYPKCYMKHISLIESVVLRIRQITELVFNKPAVFLSMMVEVFHESTQWLTRMFPALSKCNSCDVNKNSIKSDKLNRYSEIHDDPLKLKVGSLMFKISHPTFSLLRKSVFPKRYISQRNAVTLCPESDNGFDEFCELLESLENKETNFFLSTIITATLTYHLGWITTCFPFLPPDKDHTDTSSYNSLWKQISELYGANGCPIKSAQTIINGSNDNRLISKVLHFIQYFVRYTTVVHNCLERSDVNKDNETADMICLNYKSSDDLTMLSEQRCFPPPPRLKSALHKSKGWLSNLSELSKNEEYEESYVLPEKKVTFLLGENEELINLKSNFETSKRISEKVNDVVKTTTLNSPKKLNPFIKHSISSSTLHNLCESTEQEYSETSNIFKNEHSHNKSRNTNEQRVLNLYNNYQIVNSNFDYFEEKNRQRLYANRKQNMFHKISKMKILSFPLPTSKLNNVFKTAHASTLKSDTVGNYVPNMVTQGINVPQKDWILKLKRDLYLTRQICFFDGYVDESLAVVGNVDNWDVEIVSSRVNINRKSIGMKLDISSLVANMIEVLLQMWNLHFCSKYNTTHIEQRLLEICIRSYAFSQLLLHTDMCTMDLLTATLHFEINDIPLLMSVASVIAPQVTKKYGLSFQ